ncbi:MAG: hypothetical protein HN590_03995 [Calditrichaeota bacterium]|nr:hypothetical protein [Calditrichota bacterium]
MSIKQMQLNAQFVDRRQTARTHKLRNSNRRLTQTHNKPKLAACGFVFCGGYSRGRWWDVEGGADYVDFGVFK